MIWMFEVLTSIPETCLCVTVVFVIYFAADISVMTSLVVESAVASYSFLSVLYVYSA